MSQTRREFLHTAAAGAAGLAVAGRASASPPAATPKSTVFINMIGGPSQLDTFDPKPNAPSDVRGPFGPIRTNVPGLHLSELFPNLAKMADTFALIRSMHHTAPPIHEAGLQLNNTGHLFRDDDVWPSMGNVWTHLNGEHHVGAGRRHYIAGCNDVETGIAIEKGFGPGFLNGLVEAQAGSANGVGGGLLQRFVAEGRMDPRFGLTPFAHMCHGAVNSIAKFPGRFLTLNMYPTVFDSPSWDCHADRGSLGTTLDDYRTTVAPEFDRAVSRLLEALAERGLLDTTLVVATGEFGRTPKLNANGGRDHWANCWTTLIAGGGVKGGQVLGASDGIGAEPADRPVTPQELVATVYHALGVSKSATIPGPQGEPVDVYPASPIIELF
jgi:uncharacterized protein (DUF1501 family)